MRAELTAYAKCGADCSRCPWSHAVRELHRDEAAFTEYRERCKGVLGYSPSDNVFRDCVGCQTPDDQIPAEARVPLKGCATRHCVDRLGALNCAYCSRFPCGYVADHGMSWGRENTEARLGRAVSDEEYMAYVEPFEGLRHLEEIRATLGPSEIVDYPTLPPAKPRITPVPEGLPPEAIEPLRALHGLISRVKTSSLGLTDTDTLAQRERWKGRTAHFLRFLWILGRLGEPDGDRLHIAAKPYIENRGPQTSLATLSVLEEIVIPRFAALGVRIELTPLGDAWTTPSGGLRKSGWELTIRLDPKVGDPRVLDALRIFARRLDEAEGSRGFRKFSSADLRCLIM